MSEEWCVTTAVALSLIIVGMAKVIATLADHLSNRASRGKKAAPARRTSRPSPKKKSPRKRRK